MSVEQRRHRVLSAANQVHTSSLDQAVLLGGLVRSLLKIGHFMSADCLTEAALLARDMNLNIGTFSNDALRPMVVAFNAVYREEAKH